MAQASTATGTSGLVSHIQRYSVQDGPGIRTTVFLKGCPLRCAWCHNPENLAVDPQVMVIETRCVRCGACVEVCPHQPPGQRPAIESLPSRPGSDCTVCGACVEACPAGARETVGREMTVGEVLRDVLADRIFYDDSGGGVTFSGGEPLNQFEFLRCALEACRQQEVHTAVDTSGFTSRERLLEVARFTDLFLYDLKCLDEERHLRFTGVSNALILDNLNVLSRSGARIWVRVPLVPTVNDHPDELDGMARFLKGLPGIEQVNVLPYHKTGIYKFARLGMNYSLSAVRPPSAGELEAAVGRLAALGLPARAMG